MYIRTHMHALYIIQWNLSITDALGTEKQFVIQRFPLFRGYFTHITTYLDPQGQSVIERFPLFGEFVIRGSSVYTYMYIMYHQCVCMYKYTKPL